MTLVPPSPAGEVMDINIDFLIHRLPCEFITVNSQDVLGHREVNLNHFFQKVRLSSSGEILPEIKFNPIESDQPQNVFNPFVGFIQGDLNTYDTEEKQILREHFVAKEGCHLFGTLNVNKVPGGIFISVKRHYNMLSEFAGGLQNVDMENTIKHLSFGNHAELELAVKSYPTVTEQTKLTPLDGKTLKFAKGDTEASGNKVFEIYVKVVTTTFENVTGAKKMKLKALKEQEALSNKKTSGTPNQEQQKVETEVDEDSVAIASPLFSPKTIDSNIRAYQFTGSYNTLYHNSIPAIYLRYDVSPVMVTYRKEKETVWRFSVHVCAILGGIFSLAGIVDSLVHGGQHIIMKHRMNKLG
eukprot:GDKJ01012905.1.p1 GENE.GDKJ01012905.1~~GDKJ01012905.1.p1  ORF type:complete len:416 (+),score=72.37 GDKJ01012905.1:186-1250(+)